MEFNDVICPECEDTWSKIGLHWHHNPDHRPSFTDEQKQIATGVLMGDGWLEHTGNHPMLNVAVIKREYLEHLDNVFDTLSTGVKLKQSAEDVAASMDRDFTTTVNEENYHDVWKLTIRSHPWLHNLKWYNSGSKLYPDDLDLTPLTFKHWYVCDGYFNTESKYIVIGMSNEIENTKKIQGIFDSSPIPEPDAWDECNIRWHQGPTSEIFELIGEPIDGFEYKWK